MMSLQHARTDLPRIAADALDRLRSSRPRIHCLMNGVVQKFVADGLTTLGSIPSMTSSVEEVQAFVEKADALAVNLGTLDAQRREAIGLAVTTAGETGRRWVLDPAHCDTSPPRAAFAQDLLARGPAVIRANPAELALLDVPEAVVAIETGAIDRVAGGRRSHISITNGHPLMAMVTGTGCMSGAIVAAFLVVEPDPVHAAAAAMLVIGVAAEIAAARAAGPGSFEPALLDAIAALRPEQIIERARVENDEG